MTDTRKPDQAYILTEEKLLESVIRGAAMVGLMPSGLLALLERGQLEHCSNGVVVRLWLRSEPNGWSTPETPESLDKLLQALLSDNERPPIAKIRSWLPVELLEVSRWARTEWAHQNPIKGHPLPERRPMPLVLGKGGPDFSFQSPATGRAAKPPVKAAKKRASKPGKVTVSKAKTPAATKTPEPAEATDSDE